MKTIIEINDAILTPTKLNKKNLTFTGCVYDHLGDIVKSSQRTKNNVEWIPVDPDTVNPKNITNEISGRCLYLGHYMGHYGHFLLETLSRIWALSLNDAYDKYVFHSFVHDVPRSFSPSKISFECFGIKPKKIFIVKHILRFKNLTVPSALVEINNGADMEQAIIYNTIKEYCRKNYSDKKTIRHKFFPWKYRKLPTASRIYLSKNKTSKNITVKNEAQIEKLFASLGFTVLHPQQYPFEQQVVLYQNIEIMAGLNGSAMHNSVFLKKEAMVITIGDLRFPNKLNTNQKICNDFSGVHSVFIPYKEQSTQNIDKGRYHLDYLKSKLIALLK